MLELFERARAGRHRHGRRGAGADGRARGDRRPVVPVEPVQPDARPPSTPCSTPGSSSARRSCATSSRRPARSPGSATRTRPRSRRRSTGPRASCSAVSQRRVATGFSPLKTLLHDAYDRLDYLHAHRGEISGVRTGFADLDALTTGLQKSDLIVLAARPSVGKTSFALNIAEHAAVSEGKSVGVFSLEMSKEQLVLRLLSSVANIDSQRLRTGFLEEMDFARLAPGDERPVGGAGLHRRHAEHHARWSSGPRPAASRPRPGWT